MLADTERGLTGTQIERLLQEIEVADPSPGLSKWKRLFNALAGAQNTRPVGNHLIMLINRGMNPVNYARELFLLSASVFWGDSKILDNRADLVVALFPELEIRERALVVSVFLPKQPLAACRT